MMSANERLTMQALKDHDKVQPKLSAAGTAPTRHEVRHTGHSTCSCRRAIDIIMLKVHMCLNSIRYVTDMAEIRFLLDIPLPLYFI